MNQPSDALRRYSEQLLADAAKQRRDARERDRIMNSPAAARGEPNHFPFLAKAESKEQLLQFVHALFLCGHAHHFKVLIDERSIIGSEMAMDCLRAQ